MIGLSEVLQSNQAVRRHDGVVYGEGFGDGIGGARVVVLPKLEDATVIIPTKENQIAVNLLREGESAPKIGDFTVVEAAVLSLLLQDQ